MEFAQFKVSPKDYICTPKIEVCTKKQQEEDINIGEAYGKAEKFIEDTKDLWALPLVRFWQ